MLKARRYTRVAAFGVLGFVTGVLITTGILQNLEDTHVPEVVVTEAVETLQASSPVNLIIPKIDLETSFAAPLGLNQDQTVEVPDSFEHVGWYKYGPTPGELGPAVVLGHVDSKEGPAVFYSLGQLAAGDSVFIEREDGSTVEFLVTRAERYDQDGFPRAEVYGDLDHAGLRLITCSGVYDRGKQRYTHNLVVYAELKTSN